MSGTLSRSGLVRRWGILCGIAGPIVYALVLIVAGSLRPGYSHVTQMMSELGETGAPYAPVMNLAGFFLTGCLILFFAAAFYDEFRGTRGVTPAASLLAAIGVAFIAEAFFRCDAGCIPATPAGSLHLQLGQLSMVVAVLAAVAIAYVLRSAGNWQGYWQYSVLTAILILVLLPLMLSRPDLRGLFQRLMVGVIFVWWEVLAIRMYVVSSRRFSPAAP